MWTSKRVTRRSNLVTPNDDGTGPSASGILRPALLLADALLAVVLAPSCAACGELLERPTNGPVCAACWDSILPLTPPLCEACGDPLPAWRTASQALACCPR